MSFKPALNLTDQIADLLAEQIIFGELQGGERIQEVKIAKGMDVSRGTVREALLILERRHLIELVPRRGAVVNQIGRDEFRSLVSLLAAAELDYFSEIITRIKNNELADVANLFSRLDELLIRMESAARINAHRDVLAARDQFYWAVLVYATKYSVAVFESLLPSSQIVLGKLLGPEDQRDDAEVTTHTGQRVEALDVARYYRALFNAIKNADEERLGELLNGFRNRLHRLGAEVLQVSPSVEPPRSVKLWTRRQAQDVLA